MAETQAEVTNEHLAQVRDMLLDGRIQKSNLNMGYCGGLEECGTVACIGGWAYFLANGPENYDATVGQYVRGDEDRDELYFPECAVNYDAITPQQAAQAITNFLDGGDPKWAEVLS